MASQAQAWAFSSDPICTISHSEAAADIVVTYDPRTALYAIAITKQDGWPTDPGFSIRFSGANNLTISTTRHSVVGNTLTVTDRGFGNVLNGLAFNTTATAFTESAAVTVSLEGASEPVDAFRACASAPIA
ncbi:MAG: hypothetical protein HRU30_00225 [Rhodobacteraceae bacterium]|nr:hypothetical protein [Paracoccaceae bacterium]